MRSLNLKRVERVAMVNLRLSLRHPHHSLVLESAIWRVLSHHGVRRHIMTRYMALALLIERCIASLSVRLITLGLLRDTLVILVAWNCLHLSLGLSLWLMRLLRLDVSQIVSLHQVDLTLLLELRSLNIHLRIDVVLNVILGVFFTELLKPFTFFSFVRFTTAAGVRIIALLFIDQVKVREGCIKEVFLLSLVHTIILL